MTITCEISEILINLRKQEGYVYWRVYEGYVNFIGFRLLCHPGRRESKLHLRYCEKQ